MMPVLVSFFPIIYGNKTLFIELNSIFLTFGLISFLIDFGDEIRIPQIAVCDSGFSTSNLKKFLGARVRRAMIITPIFILTAFITQNFLILAWIPALFGASLNLSFWYKSIGNMGYFISRSLVGRISALLLLTLPLKNYAMIYIAAFIFYFASSAFLVLKLRVWEQEVNGKAPLFEVNNVYAFLMLLANMLLNWVPFQLQSASLLHLSTADMATIRASGFFSQVIGIITSIKHRLIWIKVVKYYESHKRAFFIFVLYASTLTGGVILLQIFMNSSVFTMVFIYCVLRVFFFSLTFLVGVHIVKLKNLALMNLFVVIAWSIFLVGNMPLRSGIIVLEVSYLMALLMLLASVRFGQKGE